MSLLDDAIGVFSPGWKAARLRSRAMIQAYEAVKPTRTHKARRENRSANQLSQMGAVSLREQARWLDNNHDLVIGVFDKLEERVVGAKGIIVEPHPVLKNGKIAKKLAEQIRAKWAEWSVSPEVTGQFTRPMLERLMLRSWLRDGEIFAQMVNGSAQGLDPVAGVPFWLEALEADFVPMTNDESAQLCQGVYVDNWGRPKKYLVYKSLPVTGRQLDTKDVDAGNMLHLKFTRRLHQTRGTSLLALTERGIGVSSYNPMQMVGLALTHSTSDFGNILLDVANKAILQGWDEAAETFEQWTKKGQLSDFKTAHRVGMGGFPSLRQVREGAEYKYVTTGDKGETIALATYGEIFAITRQAIINDDLNQLTDVPMKMGRAAKATIGDLVYAILTKNPKLSDGKALFHADHKNLSTGAISVSSLDDARKLMRLQKEGERSLNIRPAFMLVPVALETLANQTIKSASVKGADINAGIINPIQNFADVIAEARLDEADAKAWYLMAAKGTDTIEVAYLNGVDTPYIDQQEGFTTDGIATKVRIDAGVAPLDYRGLVKSSGQ